MVFFYNYSLTGKMSFKESQDKNDLLSPDLGMRILKNETLYCRKAGQRQVYFIAYHLNNSYS